MSDKATTTDLDVPSIFAAKSRMRKRSGPTTCSDSGRSFTDSSVSRLMSRFVVGHTGTMDISFYAPATGQEVETND